MTKRDVTIVVPTRNSERTIERCLRSLRAQSMACTLVVVDNRSTDNTAGIAQKYADLVITAGPERSEQRNLGARESPADIVGFIDSDMIVPTDSVAQVLQAIDDGAGAVIMPEWSSGSTYWARVRAFERQFYVGCDAVEAARFFRWEIFDTLGGFDSALTGPEDWDLTIRARAITSVARVSATIEHDEGALHYLDACRKKAHYASGLRTYAKKHGANTILEAANRPWLHHPGKVVTTPAGWGLIALKAGEAIAVTRALVLDAIRQSRVA